MSRGPVFFSPSLPILLAFCAASLAMNVTPGLDTMFVLSQTLNAGAGAGRWAAFGIATGSLCQACLAALGISALVAASPQLLAGLTYAGAAYLVWIGVKMLRHPAAVPVRGHEIGQENERQPLEAFRRGALTNLSNVKVILFYIAFLPQFIRPDAGPRWQQVFFFGLIFNVLGTSVLLAVAASSDWVIRRVAPSGGSRVFSRVAGAMLISLAAALALFRKPGL